PLEEPLSLEMRQKLTSGMGQANLQIAGMLRAATSRAGSSEPDLSSPSTLWGDVWDGESMVSPTSGFTFDVDDLLRIVGSREKQEGVNEVLQSPRGMPLISMASPLSRGPLEAIWKDAFCPPHCEVGRGGGWPQMNTARLVAEVPAWESEEAEEGRGEWGGSADGGGGTFEEDASQQIVDSRSEWLASVRFVSSHGHPELGGLPPRGGGERQGVGCGQASAVEGGAERREDRREGRRQNSGCWRPAAAQGLRLPSSLIRSSPSQPQQKSSTSPRSDELAKEAHQSTGWDHPAFRISADGDACPHLRYDEDVPTLLESPRRLPRMSSRSLG
ncbi:MAG: hypothetical protein SGPRY_011694, partial [Prymnesium sp.]